MSLKNDLEMVKEELNSEEKFFEKAVVTERFIKKYKNLMIGGVVALVLGVGINIIYNISEQNRIEESNKILAKLQLDNTNSNLEKELKSLSPTLYDAWKYSSALENDAKEKLKEIANTKTFLVKDLVKYELSQDAQGLESYAQMQNATYKDLALVQSAVLLMKENKIDEAHEKLAMIREDSSLYKVASTLLHYGVK